MPLPACSSRPRWCSNVDYDPLMTIDYHRLFQDEFGAWCYLRPPNGMLVELVSSELLAVVEPWLAAGLHEGGMGTWQY